MRRFAMSQICADDRVSCGVHAREEKERKVKYADLLVLCARRQKLAVRAEADAPDVEVARLGRLWVYQNAVTRDQRRAAQRRRDSGTHQVFAPVLVSYICADRLHPVARYLPSAEKRTQQTTLIEIARR